MYLENLVFDTADHKRVGDFWTGLLGLEVLTDEPEGYEARLIVPDGPSLDLCFQSVPESATAGPRLHLDLYGGAGQQDVVQKALDLGAARLDIGQGDVPWVVLGDVEGSAFCVMEERDAYVDTGPIAAIPIDSADPAADLQFWAELSGWHPAAGIGLHTLRHASNRGVLLEFCPEPEAKTTAKNRLHLDLRLEPGDDLDAIVRRIDERGGQEQHHPEWGELPWRMFTDPSGNEFCILTHR